MNKKISKRDLTALELRAAKNLSNYGGLGLAKGSDRSVENALPSIMRGYAQGAKIPAMAGYTEQDIRKIQGIQTYQLTLTNAALATRNALLSPGILSNAAGLIATGAFNDTNGDAGLSGAGSPRPINFFNAFTYQNPFVLYGMKIQSTDATQIDQVIGFTPQSPFNRSLQSQDIPIGLYNNQDSQQDKTAFVDLSPYAIILGNQTELLLPVVASSTCTLILFVGPVVNLSAILDAKMSGAGM